MKKSILLSLFIVVGTFSSTFANIKVFKPSLHKAEMSKKMVSKKSKIDVKANFDYCCQATVTVSDSEGNSAHATAQFCSVTSMGSACGLATFAATLQAIHNLNEP